LAAKRISGSGNFRSTRFQSPRLRKSTRASPPTRLSGWIEEIANLVVFAVSDAASYINGAELVADNAMDKS